LSPLIARLGLPPTFGRARGISGRFVVALATALQESRLQVLANDGTGDSPATKRGSLRPSAFRTTVGTRPRQPRDLSAAVAL